MVFLFYVVSNVHVYLLSLKIKNSKSEPFLRCHENNTEFPMEHTLNHFKSICIEVLEGSILNSLMRVFMCI